jgi:hypothetical protein
MTTAFNTQHEENPQLTTKEAFEFFDAAVRERLHISGQEFLQRREEFKSNPHYETLMFMVPLTVHAAD